MNAAEYFDWWHYSGTGLGTTFPGETLKQLRQELSRAGATVVIVCKFLEQSPEVLDVARWRRTQVYGLEGAQVQLTSEALEAVGALGAARAAREAKPAGLGLAGPSAGKTGASPDRDASSRAGALPEMLDKLREKIIARHPETAGQMSEEMRGRLRQPQQTEGAETREEVARLLEDYVAAHQEELAGDVARHGDPRRAPGFDPQRFLEEQARQSKRLFLFRDQRAELPLLREKLERLRQRIDAAPPDSPPVQRERQQVMKEHHRYTKYDPEDLTADVRAWLEEVDRLREKHPEVFRPRATRNEQVHAKLAAIGDYRAAFDNESRTVRWSSPSGLECDWTRFALVFLVYCGKKAPDAARLDEAYESLIAVWERFRVRFPELEPQLKQFVLDVFRMYRACELDEDERGDYEDEHGQIPDEKILANVAGGGVHLMHNHSGVAELVVHFDVRWDDEHGVEVQFDADGEILRWF